jgi:hypothetical protein
MLVKICGSYSEGNDLRITGLWIKLNSCPSARHEIMWMECKYRLNELLNLEVDENEGFALQRFRFSSWEKALPTN